jgi:hypothetical protein
MRKEYNRYINIYGSSKDIEVAVEALNTLPQESFDNREGKIRLKLQKLIKEYKLKADILFDGNIIWDEDKILKNIKTIVKSNDMNKMSNYLYNFLSLECGSIAHYDKHGWIGEYPTVGDLKEFFIKNEFGQSPLNYQPSWATDRKNIIKEIEKILKISKPTRKSQFIF